MAGRRRREPPYRPTWVDLWNGSFVARRPDGRWYKRSEMQPNLWWCYLSEEAGDDPQMDRTWIFVRELSRARAIEWPHYHWAEESGNMVEHREGQRW